MKGGKHKKKKEKRKKRKEIYSLETDGAQFLCFSFAKCDGIN